MSNFTVFLKQLGRGKRGQKNLTREQACAAMQLILNGDVSDMQLGAFLLLLRVKEETAEELAGFVDAIHENLTNNLTREPFVDISVASYGGKRRHNAWFILALCALANSGKKVIIHGSEQGSKKLTSAQIFQQLSLPISNNIKNLEDKLHKDGIVYYSINNSLPNLEKLLSLKSELGLRTAANTLARIINPFNATYCVSSFFHTSYGPLQQKTALLTNQSLLTFKGDGGEIEIRPQANTQLLIAHKGLEKELTLAREIKEKPEDEAQLTTEALQQTWRSGFTSNYAEHAIKGTIKAILLAFYPSDATDDNVNAIWNNRQKDFI